MKILLKKNKKLFEGQGVQIVFILLSYSRNILYLYSLIFIFNHQAELRPNTKFKKN